MSDKFEAWYKKTFTVNMKFDLQDCWETAYDSGYNQGLAKGRTESKLMDRHTKESIEEAATLKERERIVTLINDCPLDGLSKKQWLKLIVEISNL